MPLSQSSLFRPLSLLVGVMILQACIDLSGPGSGSGRSRLPPGVVLIDASGVVESAADASPVVGARVSVLNPDQDGQLTELAAAAVTDADGRYRVFNTIKCSESRVLVTHTAFVDKWARFSCTSGPQVLNLTLEPRP